MSEKELKYHKTMRTLTVRDWFLKRPHNYIGSVQNVTVKKYILDNNGKINYEDVNYVPGLLKMFCEAVDNSVDQYIKTNGEKSDKISITVDSQYIEVSDNGPGIRNEKNEEGEYIVYAALCKFMTGTNYDDDDVDSSKGTNGIGIKCCSTGSKTFTAISTDFEKTIQISVNDNNSVESYTFKELKHKNSTGVTLKFDPDFSILDGDHIDEHHIRLMKQYITFQALSYPEISFKFNGENIKSDERKFMNMFDEQSMLLQKNENYFFGIAPNDSDEFRLLSFVNGLDTPRGGTHVNIIMDKIVSGIREKLSKKYKNIKPADIKNKLQFVFIGRNFVNMKQDGQTKEQLTNNISDVQAYLGDISWDYMLSKILKNPDIIDPITEIYKIKEEYRLKKDLKDADKPDKKKPKDEKFLSPIGQWKRCYLAEGDSARNSISKILGRQGNGFFAMFGVPPNAYDMDMKEIIKSDKLKALQNILNLKFSQDVQDSINFEEIIIATDADLPGFFIRGQLLGLFVRFGKNLFEEHRIKIFRSPVIVGYDNNENIKEWFYDAEDLQEYEKQNPKTKLNFAWKKGLGSWDQEELEYIIEQEGIDKMLETMILDEVSEESINNWLSSKNANIRKEMLDGFEFSITNL